MSTMVVKKLEEAGKISAIYGLSLSFDRNEEVNYDDVSKKLYDKDHGHNKFLEHIIVWVSIKAPRYWWSEFDTYRVGMSKQSESTIHTLQKRIKNNTLTLESFEKDTFSNIDEFEVFLNKMKDIINNEKDKEKRMTKIKNMLPEGFIQEREVVFSYKTFREIIVQRSKHILPHWRKFIIQLYDQLDYKDYFQNFKYEIEEIKNVENAGIVI